MTKTLLNRTVSLLKNQSGENQTPRYFCQPFALEAGCTELVITFGQTSEKPAQIPVCLLAPDGRIRLTRAPNAVQAGEQRFCLGPNTATTGCLKGPLPAGEWKLLLYKRRMHGHVQAALTVQASFDGQAAPQEEALTFFNAVKSTKPGWYQGELHVHTSESTGRADVHQVVAAAKACGLDYLAVTDHFTTSHWQKLQEESKQSDCPLLLQSMEISGEKGHANIHGADIAMVPFVDGENELAELVGERSSMTDAADEAHRQGGLFCVNHALSGPVGWQYDDFDLHKADLLEAYCLPEMDTAICYPNFCDMVFAKGYRPTMVGSSDSHKPDDEGVWKLGRIRTYIYAEELSQRALLAGLKKGHAYISVNGCTMEMTAENGRETAGMGDTLTVRPGSVLSITLQKHPKGNLMLWQGGFLKETIYLGSEAPYQGTFPLTVGENTWIRAEFYEIQGELPFFGYAWRDWQTLRLLSNPIWLMKGE